MEAQARVANRTMRAELSSLPNRITLGRIALVPLLMLALRWGGDTGNVVGAIIFSLGWTTDIIDGWLARRFNNVTSLGKFLDPLADKLLVASALIMMIPLDRVPAWVAVVIIGRELAVMGLRGIASSKGHILEASSWGKHKSFVQYVAITFLILAWDEPIDCILVGQWILYAAVIITLWSGYAYLRSYAQAERELEGTT